MTLYTVEKLRSMSGEQVIEEHDRKGLGGIPAEFFLNELARRDAARQTKAMVDATQAIKWLTVVITILTLVNAAYSPNRVKQSLTEGSYEA
jgi:hypothetical protein